jgi:hypothetical protein
MIVLTLAVLGIPGRAQQAAQSGDAPVPPDQWKEMGINPPKLIKRVGIDPPDTVVPEPFNGRCLVSLIVDVNGLPQDIELVHSTDPALGKFCMDMVSKRRFSPATTRDGKAISVKSYYEYIFRRDDAADPGISIRCAFSTPSGVSSSAPDADGVYPLTKIVTPPSMTKFSDSKYSDAVFSSVGDGSSKCEIVLTISAKGKASDPVVTHCERPALEKPVVDSLLKSKYKPGSVNGRDVAIRASVHLEYEDVPPKP